MLLLAGTDRLDKDLTIAQMQGISINHFTSVGHTIQEDVSWVSKVVNIKGSLWNSPSFTSIYSEK